MKKRGELTTQQIVILIILIVSFVVILFFIVKLNLGKTTDAEICHNSVVSRGANVLPGETVPLNCKTSYICITKDGSCEKMTGNYETKKIKSKDMQEAQNEVYNILAEEMANCWWMFGEGDVNYIGEELAPKLYCSICSQISFDDSLDMFENNEIDQKNLYDYLSKTKIPEKDESYLSYLVGVKNIGTIEETLKADNSEFGKINFGKQYYIIMGAYSKAGATAWAAIGAGIGLLAGGPIGMIVGGIAGGAGGPLLGNVVTGASGGQYLSPTIIEANSTDFGKLKCESIKTLA